MGGRKKKTQKEAAASATVNTIPGYYRDPPKGTKKNTKSSTSESATVETKTSAVQEKHPGLNISLPEKVGKETSSTREAPSTFSQGDAHDEYSSYSMSKHDNASSRRQSDYNTESSYERQKNAECPSNEYRSVTRDSYHKKNEKSQNRRDNGDRNSKHFERNSRSNKNVWQGTDDSSQTSKPNKRGATKGWENADDAFNNPAETLANPDDALNKYQDSRRKRSGSRSATRMHRNSFSGDGSGHYSRDELEEEFDQFYKSQKKSLDGLAFKRVNEQEGDLFQLGDEYSLAHCVAEDMNMGSGIAVTFRQNFKRVEVLLGQNQKTGGLAVLEDKNRYIYYLVTKKLSNGKPTMLTLFSSLCRMREHIRKHDVSKVAMPRVGCGLDRLEWIYVKQMLEYVFKDVDVEIVVCNFQQPVPDAETASQYNRSRKCKVVNVDYPLINIESGTLIIYFGTMDGAITDEMKTLDEKFRILRDYKNNPRTLGKPVVTMTPDKNFVLYGCIVRNKERDPFNYERFQECLSAIQRENRKLGHNAYSFVALTAVEDGEDLFLQKMLNLLRHSLNNVSIYVCWPKELQNQMPIQKPQDTDFY